MNKELLEKRILELQENRKSHTDNIKHSEANINAIVGAIQDCEHWLSVIDESEKQLSYAPQENQCPVCQ